MNIQLQNKTVVTRKEHLCWSCGQKYPSGTIMDYTVQVDGGYFMSNYWCQICTKFMSLLDPGDLECIGCGDFWDYDGYKEFRDEL